MDEVSEIKNKIDIVDLIGQYLTLKKAGSNYQALCPFHSERTPSFMVSPEKQIYKCFGCDEGGDIFNFVMKMENLEFVEALELLADKAGVVLQRQGSKTEYKANKEKKSRIYKINDLAAKVFHKILVEHKSAESARQYLSKRKINNATIKEFNLGYAPSSKVLWRFLADRGFSEKEIAESGSPEKFFRRIIFPIRDVQGNPVGFTGRIIDKKIQPKYLNTPETKIFRKGSILFGLDKAKKFIKEKKESIVVEGQMDVISSFQTGVKNIVASSGTALTFDHLKILSRYSPNVVFSFDQDEAGENAAKRAIEMAITQGLNVKVLVLPKEFKDAGEAIEKDAKLWVKFANEAVPAIDWYFDKAFIKKDSLSGREKKEIAKKILPLVSIIPDKIEQEHYIKVLAKRLNTPARVVLEALQRAKVKSKTSINVLSKVKKNKIMTVEENLVGLLLTYPEHLSSVITKLDYTDFDPDTLLAKIYKLIESCYTKYVSDIKGKQNITSKKILEYLDKKLSDDDLKKAKFLIFEIENKNENIPPEEIVDDIKQSLSRIKKTKKDKVKTNFAQMIGQAESAGDRKKVKILLQKLQNAIKEKN